MTDTAEAIANATLGLILSVIAVQVLWPLFGWQATGAQSLAVTAIFWALSFVRSYALRRLFRRLGNG